MVSLSHTTMGGTMRELGDFLLAVVNNWAGYVTSSIIIAFVWVYTVWKGKPMARTFLLVLAGFFLLVACFKAWKEEHHKANDLLSDALRPMFDLVAPGFKQLPNSPPFRMEILMKNVGTHPAIDFSGKIIAVTRTFSDQPLTASFSVANPIMHDSPTPYYNDTVVIPPNAPPMFVVCALKYNDAISGREWTQVFFMKWGGVQGTKFEPDFTHASVDEAQEIREHLKTALVGYE